MYVPTYQVRIRIYSYTTWHGYLISPLLVNTLSPDSNIESPLLLLLLNTVQHLFVDSTLLPAVVFCSPNDITIKDK